MTFQHANPALGVNTDPALSHYYIISVSSTEELLGPIVLRLFVENCSDDTFSAAMLNALKTAASSYPVPITGVGTVTGVSAIEVTETDTAV